LTTCARYKFSYYYYYYYDIITVKPFCSLLNLFAPVY